jgi:hypothetical protein
MKKGIGILTAALLTGSVYCQAYDKPPTDPTDLSGSSSSAQSNDDFRSRQSEAGAPANTESGSVSGYERSTSSDNNLSNQSNSSESSSSSSSSASSSSSNSASNNDSSNGPSTSTTTNPSSTEQSQNNLDLSGGDSSLRGDTDLNSQFDRSNNGYNDLLEQPDMIYEEWIITEPSSVGAPGSSQSGSGSSDEIYQNDHSRTDNDHIRSDDNFDLQSRSDLNNGEVRFHNEQPLLDKGGRPADESDYFGSDVPQNSGAAATVQSGSESSEKSDKSDMSTECFDSNDAQGVPADHQTGYSEESRDRSDDGVSGESSYHINRDANSNNNNSDNSSGSSTGSNSSSSNNSGNSSGAVSGSGTSNNSSSLNQSDSDYARDLQQRVQQDFGLSNERITTAPDF